MADEITLDSLGKAAALAGGPLGLAQRYGPQIYDLFNESAKRAFEEAGKLQHYGNEYYDAGPATQAALGTIGAPAAAGGVPLGALGSGIGKGIRAYHGSPHDFERFDLSKIGTGEGAQAYGHGLYFAENPATAQSYRDKLKDIYNAQTTLKTKYRDVILDQSNDAGERLLAGVMRDAGGDAGKAATILDAYAARSPQDTAIQKALELAKNPGGNFEFRPGPSYNPGRMYEVNINAAPEQFLDWDKMVAQQQAGMKVPGIYGPTQTGEGFYRALEIAKHQPNRGHLDRQAASEFLREAGIPGIKYLDQGSRFNQALYNDNPIAKEALKFVEAAGGNSEKAAEAFYKSNPVERWAVPERDEIRRLIQQSGNKPTSNYVLFRDDIIDILRKYGLAGLAPAAGAAAVGNQPPQQQ